MFLEERLSGTKHRQAEEAADLVDRRLEADDIPLGDHLLGVAVLGVPGGAERHEPVLRRPLEG